MSVTLRPYDPSRDAPPLAQLLTEQGPEPITVAQLLEWERLRSPHTICLELTAADPTDILVGYGEVKRNAWTPPDLFRLEIIVDPGNRHRGIGTTLLNELTTFARERGATRLSADVRDHLPGALRFAQQRGFEIDRHVFESTLDLTTFNETPFADAITRAEASGIVFRSLANYDDSEAARRKAYALNIACSRDIPGHEGADRPWDEYKKIYKMSWYRPDGQIIAVDPAAAPDPTKPNVEADRFAALAAIGYFAESNSVYHMHTGVDRAYRGRGLSTAAKLVALRRAREWGAAYARTNNDSKNAPILAVNRKLGYTPKPGFYRLIRTLP